MLDSLLSEVVLLKCIQSAEKMLVMKTEYDPNDPYYGNQWYLPNIKADLAFDLWDISNGELPGFTDENPIVVGVVDVGLDWDHPDLVGIMWHNLGEDIDGDGVVIIYNGGSWIFDPGDVNGIDDDGDGYVDNFIGYDVANNDNNPVPPSGSFDHGCCRIFVDSNNFFNSATPENIALNDTKCNLVSSASNLAIVVLPTPGGPQKIID